MEYAAAAAYALMITGTAVSAYSAYESGQSQKEAATYQAAVARNNQVMAESYAKAEIAKGQRLEDAKRIETAQRQSLIRATAAASGLDVNSGSPLNLQADTATMGEYDALTIRSNAERNAQGYRTQGMNFQAQSVLDEMSGSNAERMGNLGALSSIVNGASTVSGKWAGWKTGG